MGGGGEEQGWDVKVWDKAGGGGCEAVGEGGGEEEDGDKERRMPVKFTKLSLDRYSI